MLPLLASTAVALAAPAFDASQARAFAGAHFDQGGLVVDIAAGTVVPVVDHGQTIGVGFLAEGDLDLSFADPADAIRFANRQVLVGGRPAGKLRAVAHGQAPYETRVSAGFVFGSDAVLAEWLGDEPTDGSLVVDRLDDRLALLDGAVDLSVGQRTQVGTDRWVFADFRIVSRLWTVRDGKLDADDDHWLGLLRDAVYGWPAPDVLAIGDSGGKHVVSRTVALGPWEEPPPSADVVRAELGVEALRAEGTILARTTRARSVVEVDVDTTLSIRTHREVDSLELIIPRAASNKETWSVSHIALDGIDLPLPDTVGEVLRVPLDPPLATGAQARVRVVHTDTWNVLGGGSDDPNRASPLHHPLARLGSTPAEYTLRVGTPEASNLIPALSGMTTAQSTENGVYWLESRSDGGGDWPGVAIGVWATRTEAPMEGLPAVRVNLFMSERGKIEDIPPFLRTVVAYYQQLLPPFPTVELELLQQRDDAGKFQWTADPGLITIQQMQTVSSHSAGARAGRPHLEEEVMAHEVAHQWWGGIVEPARAEDSWISETMASVYACLFVGAAYGQKDCDQRQKFWRRTWEERPGPRTGASLRDAWGTDDWIDIAYEYGPYVMLHMLRHRLGDEAFLGSLDAYASDRSGRPATTDRLERIFEATSGRDLSDFFAFWVVGGFLPKLDLELDGARGTIHSDVPFGTFDVPVVATIHGERQQVWVDVVDGIGTFELSDTPSKVKLDPEGLVLARGRRVSKR